MGPMLSRRIGVLSLGGLGWLGACSVEPVNGVTHLDPRLEDGRSPARFLAESQAVLSTSPGDDWTPSDTTRTATTEGEAAWTLRATDGRAGLRLERSIDADRWDAFEVVLRSGAATDVRLTWASQARTWTVTERAPLTLEPSTLRLELSGRPGWSGPVEDVALELATASVELFELRFVSGGFRWGDEPLDEGLADETSGDGGLLALGSDARRVWPTDADLPLVARAHAPEDGWLSLAVAPGPALTGTPARVTFAIDARAGSVDWERLADRVLPAPGERESEHWTPWHVPLGAFGGRDIELRFSGSIEDVPTRGDRPPSARLLFACPELLGTLPADRRPNLVLVTLDTLRADAVGAGWTPVLDELAANGIVFTNAWSAAESTTPSHASLLTGRMVGEHGAVGNRFVLPPENRTLPELLRAEGYHTAAAVSAFHLQSGNGFGQGFDQFWRPRPEALTNGRGTVQGLTRLIDEWRAGPERPFFLWLHLFDPHTPYGAPPGFRRRFLAEHDRTLPPARVEPPTAPAFDEYPGGFSWLEGTTNLERVRTDYALGVAHADHLVGELFDTLERDDALADTAVVVTSDHGEGFGERDIWFSHVGLFREILHVPLIVRLPGGCTDDLPPEVAAPASAIDVAPTLLRLAGAEPPATMRGRSLLATARRPDPERRIWFQHSSLLQAGFRDADVHFVDTLDDGIYYLSGSELDTDGRRVPTWGTIDAGARFLFDLDADPRELRNRADESPRTEELARSVTDWIDVLGRADVRRAELSAEDEAILKSLGYAGD